MSQRLQNEKIRHDFFNDNKWLILIDGYGESRSFLYITYIGLIYGLFLYLLATSIYGFYHVYPDKNLIIGDMHVFLCSVFGISGLTIRLVSDSHLKKTREMIQSGFYHYEDEDLEGIKNGENMFCEIQNGIQLFIFLYSVGAASNVIFFPVAQYFTVTEEQYEATVDVTDPYLPNLLYLPFSTRTTLGFILGYVVNVLIFVYIYGIASAMMSIYLSSLVQLRVQLEILNNSIKNIHKRALQMYKKCNGLRNSLQDGMYDDQGFQNCLYKCLRSNIEHHQALIRYQNDARLFNGCCMLLPLVVSSPVFASILYLIMKDPPLNYMINFVLTLLSEQAYVYYICFFGEQILNESTKLYSTIYSIPWFYCNKSFNVVLRIFMLTTKQPIEVKALFVNVTACIERYGDFLLVMYKIVNLLRQSDVD